MSRTKLKNPFVEWERWFAWYPVHVRGHRVWLETVERRKVVWGEGYVWQYRFKGWFH